MIDISLIKNWHEKAKTDYFSRYIFQYLAFEAFLKKYKYSESEVRSVAGNIKERSYIQKIKSDSAYAAKWESLISQNENLRKNIQELIALLNAEPLMSEVNWWNCTSFKYDECNDCPYRGTIRNENDFINVVEFWYEVRNNLFHAGKNPSNERDERLVTFAYNTLSVFFEKVLLAETEQRIMYPAVWEEFEYKFFIGEAEAMVKIDDRETRATVYELLFADDNYFPIIFNGKQIDKKYIVEKLSSNLTNCYGVGGSSLQKEWDKIARHANTIEKKIALEAYFGDILPLLRSDGLVVVLD